MFVIPGIVAMLAFVYIRPQEVYEAMHAVTFPMLLGLGLVGYLLDMRTGVTRPPRLSPFIVSSFFFFAWALLTIGVNAPDVLVTNLTFFAGPMGLLFFISQGVQSVRAFRVVSRGFLIVTLAVAAIAVLQGLTPTVCLIDTGAVGVGAGDVAQDQDLRPCHTREDCLEGGNPDNDYLCEHLGVMGTSSIEGRVRYRGVFQDPNELAFALSLSLPFVFGWFDGRRGKKRGWASPVLVVVVLALIITCNILTRSRSGQISLIATLGVYFLRRFGWRGAALGGALALPVLLLGGRSAESSTQERLECWSEALSLWREHPFFGVGARQFGQHHYLTAHNSALLALADMGPIGLLLFTIVIYMAFKITIQIQRDFADRPEAEPVRAAAFAVLAGLVGLVASALFLSLTYHVALWIEIALVGAVQSVVWTHEPGWRLRWRWRDVGRVIAIDLALVIGIAIYLRIKGI
jgi:O-Antigen ligase